MQTVSTNQNQLSSTITRLFEKRGLVGDKALDEFFSADLKKLPDLTNLIDLDKTALRIISAIDKNEKIGI